MFGVTSGRFVNFLMPDKICPVDWNIILSHEAVRKQYKLLHLLPGIIFQISGFNFDPLAVVVCAEGVVRFLSWIFY